MALRGIAFARKAVAYGVGAILSTVDWVMDRPQMFELALGANNLFDVYPDVRPFGPRPTTGNYPQNFQYIPYAASASPFGFNGRFLYGRVSVDF